MSRAALVKTSFASGELDPRLFGRLDLRALEDGASRLRNVVVLPTGGVTRRPGLAYVGDLPGALRLVPHSDAAGPVLVALGHFTLRLARGGIAGPAIASPWTSAQLDELSWARWRDDLILCHVDVPPRILTFRLGEWRLLPWSFEEALEVTGHRRLHQPFAKLAAAEMALQIGNGADVAVPADPDGLVMVRSSAPLFVPTHLGCIFRLRDAELRISSVDPVDPTRAFAQVLEDIETGAATRNWAEQAFSEARGWPASVAVVQDRLAIGGSRDLPDHVWISKTGHPFNFDLGTALDDEAIAFRIASEQRHAIRSLFAGRHLQVFTTAGEWVVRGAPLTPKTVELDQQTLVGSWQRRRIRPLGVDGATLFLGASGRELREFLFADSEQAYQAADIALLSRHLLLDPISLAFDGQRRRLYVVRGDGAVAAVTLDRNNNVVAWSLLTTTGRFLAIAVQQDTVWVLVGVGGRTLLERLDDDLRIDHGLGLTRPAATTFWTGLAHLEGLRVVAVEGSSEVGRGVVTGGTLTLERAAAAITVGCPIALEVEPCPPGLSAGGVAGLDRAVRPVRVSVRAHETGALRLDSGGGPRPLIAPQGTSLVTGDRSARALGWRRGTAEPLWRIAQDDPLPCTVLAVSTELEVND